MDQASLTSLLGEHVARHALPGASLGVLRDGAVTIACHGVGDLATGRADHSGLAVQPRFAHQVVRRDRPRPAGAGRPALPRRLGRLLCARAAGELVGPDHDPARPARQPLRPAADPGARVRHRAACRPRRRRALAAGRGGRRRSAGSGTVVVLQRGLVPARAGPRDSDRGAVGGRDGTSPRTRRADSTRPLASTPRGTRASLGTTPRRPARRPWPRWRPGLRPRRRQRRVQCPGPAQVRRVASR